MRKLKKWHRLGIILSLVWIIFSVASDLNSESKRNSDARQLDFKICYEAKNPINVCMSEINKDRYFINWTGHLMRAIFPLTVTWIIVICIVFSYRWIMRGD